MAASNYLGTRVDQQLNQKVRRREAFEIETYPEGEREEIRQIFAKKGFRGDDLDRAVEIITKDRERWIDTMLTDEMGLTLTVRSPLLAASATMTAFFLIGFIPLFAFVAQAFFPEAVPRPFLGSCLLTAVAFFAVGAFKSKFVEQHWSWSGLETLGIGGAAALLAYAVGAALGGIVP